MQEVLNTLERHTVCTGTQCFESEEDAFGITTTPNGSPTNNTTFFMFMMCAPHPAPPPLDLSMRREALQSSASQTSSPRRLSLPMAPGEVLSLPCPPPRPQRHQHSKALCRPAHYQYLPCVGQHSGWA